MTLGMHVRICVCTYVLLRFSLDFLSTQANVHMYTTEFSRSGGTELRVHSGPGAEQSNKRVRKD